MPAEPSATPDRPSHIPWPPILLAGNVIGAIALGYLVPLQWPGMDDFAARTIGLDDWRCRQSGCSPGPS